MKVSTDIMKILLLEDNVSTAVEMEINLTEIGHEVIATLERGTGVLAFLEEEIPDLAIVDIGLKGSIDGVEVAEQLAKAGIPIIFSTARRDTDTFERAKAVKPLAYLVKPFDKLTLQSCLDQAIRIIQVLNEPPENEEVNESHFFNDYFFIRNNGSLHKIRFTDISYIQSNRNYSFLFVNGQKYVAKISLNNLIQKLPEDQFVRIHQSYIIQFDFIEKINVNEENISINGELLPLGKTYKPALMKRINRI